MIHKHRRYRHRCGRMAFRETETHAIDNGDRRKQAGEKRKGNGRKRKNANTYVVAYRRPAISFPDTIFGDRRARGVVRLANLSQTDIKKPRVERGGPNAVKTRDQNDTADHHA